MIVIEVYNTQVSRKTGSLVLGIHFSMYACWQIRQPTINQCSMSSNVLYLQNSCDKIGINTCFSKYGIKCAIPCLLWPGIWANFGALDLVQMMGFVMMSVEKIVSLGPKYKGDGRADCKGPCLQSDGPAASTQCPECWQWWCASARHQPVYQCNAASYAESPIYDHGWTFRECPHAGETPFLLFQLVFALSSYELCREPWEFACFSCSMQSLFATQFTRNLSCKDCKM